jgi:hypothetical protein
MPPPRAVQPEEPRAPIAAPGFTPGMTPNAGPAGEARQRIPERARPADRDRDRDRDRDADTRQREEVPNRADRRGSVR